MNRAVFISAKGRVQKMTVEKKEPLLETGEVVEGSSSIADPEQDSETPGLADNEDTTAHATITSSVALRKTRKSRRCLHTDPNDEKGYVTIGGR